MRQYIAKRIIHAFFIMWLVATTVFFGLRVMPGGPVRSRLGIDASPEAVHALRVKLGLNRPIYVQYIDWMTDLLVLDLGDSLTSGAEVNTLLAQATPRTLSIAVMGIIVGLLIAIPTGIISATHKRKPIDYVATVSAFLGLSMPAFFIAILLALVFGVWLNIFPVIGPLWG